MCAHCVQSPEAASTKPALGLLILPLPLVSTAIMLFVLGVWLVRRRKAGYPEKLRDHHRTHAPVAGHHNALVVTDIEVRAYAGLCQLAYVPWECMDEMLEQPSRDQISALHVTRSSQPTHCKILATDVLCHKNGLSCDTDFVHQVRSPECVFWHGNIWHMLCPLSRQATSLPKH